jgi:capsular polysaccharide transport system permease protein
MAEMSNTLAMLSKSFEIQMRVIGALLLREIITRYGRHNIGFLWLFVEPMIFTLGITTAWTLLKATHGSTLPITAFAITGYSSLLLWRNCSNRAIQAVQVNLSLLYHRNVKVLDVLLARIILEIIGATISAILLTFLFSFMGLMDLPVDILTVLISWILLAWFSMALSLIVGGASERSEMVDRVWHVITYLMFPLSGAGFMVSWMPAAAQKYVLWVPMVHCTEMLRHGYFGDAIRTYENPSYVIAVNLIMTLIGLALVKEVGRKVEPE